MLLFCSHIPRYGKKNTLTNRCGFTAALSKLFNIHLIELELLTSELLRRRSGLFLHSAVRLCFSIGLSRYQLLACVEQKELTNSHRLASATSLFNTSVFSDNHCGESCNCGNLVRPLDSASLQWPLKKTFLLTSLNILKKV